MGKKKPSCTLCSFGNPKATVTGVILKGKKILLAKRTEAPFKGMWDIIGGYMNEKETPSEAMAREIKEELGVKPTSMKFLDFFPGYASWKKERFPILSLLYAVKLPNKPLKINEEASEVRWFSRKELPPKVAFDSNNRIIAYAKKRGLI